MKIRNLVHSYLEQRSPFQFLRTELIGQLTWEKNCQIYDLEKHLLLNQKHIYLWFSTVPIWFLVAGTDPLISISKKKADGYFLDNSSTEGDRDLILFLLERGNSDASICIKPDWSMY